MVAGMSWLVAGAAASGVWKHAKRRSDSLDV